jgi:hypothetical protein
MKIINRLPYFSEHKTLPVRGEDVTVHRNQVIVWVSVSMARTLAWDPRTPAFPAILDPGNTFNLSLFEHQLIRWAGVRPELLQLLGRIKQKGKYYPRRRADVWLHRNIPGTQKPRTDQEPFLLTLDKGIAIYPDEGPSPPHLPLLGLGALTENQLQTLIDGQRREVSVHTPNWITRLLRRLRLPPY